jgi:hypothetical protein
MSYADREYYSCLKKKPAISDNRTFLLKANPFDYIPEQEDELKSTI